jgi:probable HAF family extracellular repeat protein
MENVVILEDRTMERQVLLLAAVVTFLCPADARATIVYEVIDLGTLGGDESGAWSVNDAGQIVGWAENTGGVRHATLFDPAQSDSNIDLGTLAGNSSFAHSINDAGQIVGRSDNAEGCERACLFDPTGGGSNVDLGTLGGDESWALCINNSGRITGDARTSDSFHHHAALFDPVGSGNNIDLDTLGFHFPYSLSSAYFVNDAGQIVGLARHTDGESFHATLFDSTEGGKNVDLGTLGGEASLALSINNAGQIVGGAENPDGHERACLFDPTGAGNNIDLGTLGGDESEAKSINNKGEIVGMAHDTRDLWCATLFDPTGRGFNVDLNTLIDPACGWTLTEAHDINASGWIVGEGINPQGEVHAFLLVPEPATFALLACGALCLRRGRPL